MVRQHLKPMRQGVIELRPREDDPPDEPEIPTRAHSAGSQSDTILPARGEDAP